MIVSLSLAYIPPLFLAYESCIGLIQKRLVYGQNTQETALARHYMRLLQIYSVGESISYFLLSVISLTYIVCIGLIQRRLVMVKIRRKLH